jgi:hypothetical protein
MGIRPWRCYACNVRFFGRAEKVPEQREDKAA